MKAKITTALLTVTVLTNLDCAIYAQSPITKVNSRNFTLHGDSLVNIDDRNTQNDFGKFFTRDQNAVSDQLPFSQSLSLPDIPITLQPADQNVNGNDGLEVQLDMGSIKLDQGAGEGSKGVRE